jgi:hypothetical protein
MIERHYGALLYGAYAGIAGRLDALETELEEAALKSGFVWADSEDVRRAVSLLLFASVLVGCQSSNAGFYDKQAKDEALRAAKKDPFDGHSKVVSVGSVKERDECPQAPSPEAGPCLDVTVTS